MKQAIYKVPEGKLLKLFLETDGDTDDEKIASIKITGDFFMHPEEKIEMLEAALIGEALEEEQLKKTLADFVAAEEIQLFGVDPASIAHTIMLAANN